MLDLNSHTMRSDDCAEKSDFPFVCLPPLPVFVCHTFDRNPVLCLFYMFALNTAEKIFSNCHSFLIKTQSVKLTNKKRIRKCGNYRKCALSGIITWWRVFFFFPAEHINPHRSPNALINLMRMMARSGWKFFARSFPTLVFNDNFFVPLWWH